MGLAFDMLYFFSRTHFHNVTLFSVKLCKSISYKFSEKKSESLSMCYISINETNNPYTVSLKYYSTANDNYTQSVFA